MRIAGIYKITNTATNKSYIGQSLDVRQRIIRHRCQLKSLKHVNPHLVSSCRIHGIDSFEFEVLFVVMPSLPKETIVDALNMAEADLISAYDSFNNGYNLTTGGDGHVVSADTILRLKASHPKKPRPPKVYSGPWNKGKRYTTRPASAERKSKIGQAQLGSLNHNFGRATPEVVKQKCRASYHGSQCHLAKLDDPLVSDIKRALDNGETGADLARQYGISKHAISDIKNGKTWRHVA
jgi:group I intron endonuclease